MVSALLARKELSIDFIRFAAVVKAANILKQNNI